MTRPMNHQPPAAPSSPELHNEHLEVQILATIMRAASVSSLNLAPEVASAIGAPSSGAPHRFHFTTHQAIYGAMLAISDRGGLPTAGRVTDELRRSGRIAEIGRPGIAGEEYIRRTESAASISDPEEYATALDQLCRLAALREVEAICRRSQIAVTSGDADVPEIVESATRDLWHVVDDQTGVQRGASAGDMVGRFDAHLEALRSEGADGGIYMRFGIEAVDMVLQRLIRPKRFVLVAAHTGVGKTQGAVQLIRANGIHGNLRPVLIELEMPDVDCQERIIAAETGIKLTHLQTPAWLTPEDLARLNGFNGMLRSRPDCYRVEEMPGATLQQIVAKIRLLSAERGVDEHGEETRPRLFIIDYTQIIEIPYRNGVSREREVATITRTLKRLAMELDIIIVALSQLNDEMFSRPLHQRYPQKRDLRESKAQVQDADCLVMIDRPAAYDVDRDVFHDGMPAVRYLPNGVTVNLARIYIAKLRKGRTGTVHVGTEFQYGRFSNLPPGLQQELDHPATAPVATAPTSPGDTDGEAF